MLQVQHFHLTQRKDNRVLVEDLSFVINSGEKVAIIGEEGDGKSSLLRWIDDPMRIEPYAEATGERYSTEVIGYLPQELTPQESGMPVCEWMESACAIGTLSYTGIVRAAKSLSLDPGLLWETRTFGSLSGGERIKVQLCALLLRDCDLLLLDEPSNDLDLAAVRWLESFLRQTNKTVLYVSHDELLLERTAEAIIHLEQVRRKTIPRATFARKPYRQYIEERERQFAHQMQAAAFEQDEFRKKKDRYLSIYQAVDHAQSTISRGDPSGGRLLKKKMHAVQSLGKRLEKEREALTQMPEAEWAILPKIEDGVFIPNGRTVLDLSIDKLSVGERTLVENVRLGVRGPERVFIIGQNGCGKSTLLKRIASELVGRKDLSVGYMPQSYDDALDPSQTPVSFLAPHGDKASVTKARLYLGSMKYTTDEMEHPVRELSGGQRAKLLLLKLILDRNNVWILDEPTRNFSPLSAPAVRELLCSFGGTVIGVSHDRKLLQQTATAIYRLEKTGLIKVDPKEM